MGKANQYKTDGDNIVSQNKINKEFSAQAMKSIQSFGFSSPGSPSKGLAPLNDKSKVSKLGGRMQGALGLSHNVVPIVSGAAILDNNNGVQSSAKSYISLVPESLVSDTLDNITGRKYEGQLLIINNATSGTTITLTDGAGGIGGMACPDGVDFSLPYPNSVMLIDDPEFGTQTWRVIGTTASSGSTWVGTATSDLDMSGFDIIDFNDIKGVEGDKYIFAADENTYMTGSETSGRINIYNNSSNISSFLTSGFLTTNITCSSVSSSGNVDVNGNRVVLDSNADSYIQASSDDIINFITNDNIRLTITNLGTTISGTLLVTSTTTLDTLVMAADIEIGGNDLDFTTGGTVDFHDVDSGPHSSGGASALPALPTSYFTVKYRGATRYIPYYS